MDIVAKNDTKKTDKAISSVYKRRVLDSKDIDFIVQYYVQNLNKQSIAHTKKAKRKKAILVFLSISCVLLVFAAYKASVRVVNHFSVSGVENLKVDQNSSYKSDYALAEEKTTSISKTKPKTSKIKKTDTFKRKKIALVNKSKTKPKASKVRKTDITERKKNVLASKPKTKPKASKVKKTNTTERKKNVLASKPKTKPKTPKVRKTDTAERKKIALVSKPKTKQKASKVRKTEDEISSENPSISVEKIVICENVKNLKPVNEGDTFSTKRVFCWLRLKSDTIPYNVHFTFYYGGKWIYRYTANIRRKNAVTWCYKTIWESGEWLVRLTDDNENLLASKIFLHE